MNFEQPKPYPLYWPIGWARTKTPIKSQFRTTLPGAKKNVESSLQKFAKATGLAISQLVISSNASLMDDKPADPGVAAWFVWDGQQVCLAVDLYNSVEGNLQAIHHILEARVTETRHGGLNIIRQTVRGFHPKLGGFNPWEVLGLEPKATEKEIKDRYHQLAAKYHTDNAETGDREKFDAVQRAYEAVAPKQQGAKVPNVTQP